MNQPGSPDQVLTEVRAEGRDAPFNLSKLRLSQDFTANLGVKKALIFVPVRKPDHQDFIRVHPGEDWRLLTKILELKRKGETFLVDRELWEQLQKELISKVLFTVINRQGDISLWPIRLPGEDGRLDTWNRSALEAANMAESHWIRVTANMSLGAYEVQQAPADLQEPQWPEVTFGEIVDVAFKDRFIHSLDHPVLRRLRGEI